MFGSYGGMMRGGNTEATVVIADGAIEAPPTVGRGVVGDRHAPRLLGAHVAPAAAREPGAGQHDGVRGRRSTGRRCTVVEVPATDLAVDLGNIMTASMVMLGAYVAATGLVALDALDAAVAESLPSYRTQHVARNVAAHRGRLRRRTPRGSSPAWHETRRWCRHDARVLTRGTVVIDVEACKGCDLCIDACPPRVLEMTTHDVNARGYRYPRLLAGLHRVPGVRADLPRLLFQVYKYDTPARAHGRRRVDDARLSRRAARGLGGDRRGDGRRRLPLLRRLPDDAVHRGARAHGGQAARRRRRLHERRERARGGRHGVGRGRHRHARGDRLDRPGALADAGVARRGRARRGSRSSCSTWRAAQGDYFQATRGRRPRRLPRMPVLAPMDVPEAAELDAAGVPPRRRWRNPVLLFGDYYLAHTSSRSTIGAARLRPAAGRGLGARRVHQRHRPGAGSLSPLGTTKRNATTAATTSREHYAECARRGPRRCRRASSRWSRPASLDDAEVVVVAFGTPGEVRARRGRRRCGPRAHGSGSSGPSRCCRSRREPSRRRRSGARRVAVYENNQGQMIDDVRLAVARARRRCAFIGGLSLDGSGFGIAPDLDARLSCASRHRGSCCA